MTNLGLQSNHYKYIQINLFYVHKERINYMSQFLKIVQGVDEKIRVYDQNAILIIKNTTNILTFNTVEEQDGDLWLKFKIDSQNYMEGGLANYQLFQNNTLKEYGSCQIIPSLLVDPNQDVRGRYAAIVEAIEKQIAGVASTAQKHIQVGDKTIDKYSASQLLSLLTYFQGKLAEEESGSKVNTKSDQMKILYKWTLR